MLNKEKYAKEIIEVLVQNNDSGLAVVEGKPVSCDKTECEKRGFTFNSLLEAREKQEPK